MAKSLSELRELNGKPVLLSTASGKRLSTGQIVVTEDAGRKAVQRVEVAIETGEMKCRVGIPPDEWEKIAESWDGAAMRYVLRASDDFWSRQSSATHTAGDDRAGKDSVPKKD